MGWCCIAPSVIPGCSPFPLRNARKAGGAPVFGRWVFRGQVGRLPARYRPGTEDRLAEIRRDIDGVFHAVTLRPGRVDPAEQFPQEVAVDNVVNKEFRQACLASEFASVSVAPFFSASDLRFERAGDEPCFFVEIRIFESAGCFEASDPAISGQFVVIKSGRLDQSRARKFRRKISYVI